MAASEYGVQLKVVAPKNEQDVKGQVSLLKKAIEQNPDGILFSTSSNSAANKDLKKAKDLIETLLKQDDSIIQDEDIKVFVDSLADSSVILGLRAWVKTEEYWSTRWRLLEEIKLIFDEEGIEIPFNQLTVHMAEK